jgi:hypothetical protein
VKTLTINKLIFQNELKVEFSGAINEDADFKSLDSFDQSSISFDFGKVDMINSCGIREWIKFIEKVPETSQIIYRNCPQIIIEQLNMVHGFFKKGSIIESFCAPYFCETCDKENKVQILTSQIENKKAPKIKCPECGKFMEFDAIESQYLSFLGKL